MKRFWTFRCRSDIVSPKDFKVDKEAAPVDDDDHDDVKG
jgi:hypothetical protein